ncbi:geranylgeranyl diphosphate synthase type I [Actinoplanes octamycinicus]|uniref:Geranylgeranyl diphosphate synthase type I n=1 Tax=Actinoplanes octamycinicus TaxID=135948 RepID=A0A7W7H1T3_9ACTN|nr:polyprenyl synthetase family protein [Actinoplanes octamycinicus]MBB4742132.1 geranylgeranyl diphosphate synthase type I [Actinoplanes octamycinicus]GIE60022.1 geranylgeranyl pyrophosphate synthase [Actinoplanes octamycinicus]
MFTPSRRPQAGTTTTPAIRSSPLDAEDLRGRVRSEIERFLAAQTEVLAEVSDDCAPLVRYVADLMSGGKRLRPAFCYWAWRAAGAPNGPAVLAAATALEFLQAAALVHDDIMDASDTRRGAPSMHRRFAALHTANRWDSDAEQFGMSAAVLAGDLCLTWSDALFSGSGLPPAALARGRGVFDRMRIQLMGGQYLDLVDQAGAGRDRRGALERARRVAHFKSAKYTVEHPLLLGGHLAGAGSGVLERFSAFGLPLGEAFQLRDDLLGVFGDPARTGKPAGDDLREGKRTALIALTVERATDVQKKVLQALLGDRSLPAADIDVLREVIADTGAPVAVERMIDELVERARTALDTTDLEAAGHAVLLALAEAATDRSL